MRDKVERIVLAVVALLLMNIGCVYGQMRYDELYGSLTVDGNTITYEQRSDIPYTVDVTTVGVFGTRPDSNEPYTVDQVAFFNDSRTVSGPFQLSVHFLTADDSRRVGFQMAVETNRTLDPGETYSMLLRYLFHDPNTGEVFNLVVDGTVFINSEGLQFLPSSGQDPVPPCLPCPPFDPTDGPCCRQAEDII